MIQRFTVPFLLAGVCLAQNIGSLGGSQLAAIAHRPAVLLQADRKEVAVDPKILAHYVGAYELAPGVNMLVTLDGNQVLTKLGPQQRVPIFPQSQTMFFAKVVDAQIEFAKFDASGVPGQLILHQNGRDQPANRLGEAEFKQIADAAAAFDKRFKDQTAAPGSEAAVRRMLDELRAGKPNYDLMSPGLAAATRDQLSGIQDTFAQFGAVQSISFSGVGPGGADIYLIEFEGGAVEYRIWLTPDGKVDSSNFRPAQ